MIFFFRKGKPHSSSAQLRVSNRTKALFLNMCREYVLTMAIKPSLHSYPIDNNNSLFNFGYTNTIGDSKRFNGNFSCNDDFFYPGVWLVVNLVIFVYLQGILCVPVLNMSPILPNPLLEYRYCWRL